MDFLSSAVSLSSHSRTGSFPASVRKKMTRSGRGAGLAMGIPHQKRYSRQLAFPFSHSKNFAALRALCAFAVNSL